MLQTPPNSQHSSQTSEHFILEPSHQHLDYFCCQDSLSFWDPAKSRQKSASSTTIYSGMNMMVLGAGVVGEIKSLGGDPLLFFVFLRSHSSLWQLQTLQAEQYSMSLVCFTHTPRVRKNSCHNGQLQISEFGKFSCFFPWLYSRLRMFLLKWKSLFLNSLWRNSPIFIPLRKSSSN